MRVSCSQRRSPRTTPARKLDGGSEFDAYNSGKAALRGYANNLDTALRAGGSRHSTLDRAKSVPNQHAGLSNIRTPSTRNLSTERGLSDTDPAFNDGITFVSSAPWPMLCRQAWWGEAYTQLSQTAEPAQNVVVASPIEPFATMGGNRISSRRSSPKTRARLCRSSAVEAKATWVTP